VRRCFKCWGFYHIAKECKREVACHRCAGGHISDKCEKNTKKCVNCAHKIQRFNIKIDDEHGALSAECPTYQRALREERRRTGVSEDD